MKRALAFLLTALFLLNAFSLSALAEDKIIIDSYTLRETDGGYDTVWLDKEGKETDLFAPSREKSGGMKAKAVLPPKYSSVDKGYVTSIKNQGVTGSCWAFSMAAATETSLVSRGFADSTVDLSESHHVWFTHNSYVPYTPSDGSSGDGTESSNPYEDGGNWRRSSFSLSRGSGWANEEDYPYSPQDPSKMGNYTEEDRYVSSYYPTEICGINENIASIKNAILSYGSVGAGYYSVNSYYSSGAEGYCYYCPNGSLASNHQIIIVGWDDSFSAENFKSNYRPSSDGAWLCKNSYGESWGDKGYFYLSYCDGTLSSPFAVKAEGSDFFSRIYQYDGYGYAGAITARRSTGEVFTSASAANVFTASDDEIISSVGFHTTTEAEYTIKVYTGVDNTDSSPLKGGELVAQCSGSVDNAGYYVARLNNSAFVKKDEKFAVVLEIRRDAGAPVAVEGQDGFQDASFTRHYHSEAGQSYYMFGDDGIWYQTTGEQNNVCVKAFAKKAEPVEIGNAEELCDFAATVNSGESFLSRQIKLTADIDMKNVSFTPIGTAENPFKGTFDGQKHTIRNLTVSGKDNTGFFGCLGNKAVVNNLGIENCNITGENYVGALAGYCEGERIFRCYATGSVTGEKYCGGLFGYSGAQQVSNCYAMCDVYCDDTAGSFAGASNSKYENSFTLSGLPVSGSGICVGVYPASREQFKKGYVPYTMNGSENVWTKGTSSPGFYLGEDDKLFRVNIYDTDTDETFYIYVRAKEKVKDILQDDYPLMEVGVFSDYLCTKPFTDFVKFDRTLYLKLTVPELTPTEDADIDLVNGLVRGIGEGLSVLQLKAQFCNENIVVKDCYGNDTDDYSVVTTGCRIYLLSSKGVELDFAETVIYGDLNCDGWIDAFDLSLMSAYISYEIDDGDLTPGRIEAFDTDHSGSADELDLVLLDLASVFCYEISQK